MDELNGLRDSFAAVPDPDPIAVEQARRLVRGQATPLRSLPYRPNRTAVVGIAAACLALAGAGVVAVNGHGGPGSAPAGTAGTAGTAMNLTGYRQAAAQALDRRDYVVRSTQTLSTPTGVENITQWDGSTGPTSEWRIQTRDPAGHLLDDHAVRRTVDGDEQIEYVGAVNEYARWSIQLKPNPKKTPPPNAKPPVPQTAQERIKLSLANGNLVLVGPVRLAGRAAILLTYTEGRPGEVGYKQGKLWIDPTSYLTLQDTVTMDGDTSTIHYDYLDPTAANRALLWITPQPGWRQVSSDDLPRNLVS